MAWYAYGHQRTVGGVDVLSSYSSAGEGVWLSDRDITDSSMPSLTATRGILINLSECMTYGATTHGSSYSQSHNWPIMTGRFTSADWVHNSNYPYIGIANARLILCSIKGGTDRPLSTILNNSVYLTESYNGVIDDEINVSTSASNGHDGYEVLYASGSYGNFPDYRNDGTDNLSYCYGPTLVSSITSYSDINTYLNQGYCYAGIYFNMLRQQFLDGSASQTGTWGYGYVDIEAPKNTYCTAEYSSSFTGSKVKPDRWKDIQSAKVYVNGAWKDVKSMKVCVGGKWKEVPQTQTFEWATRG